MRVEVIDETARFSQSDLLERTLAALGRELGVAATDEVTVVLVDDTAMAARNRADRGVDGPTDVLAYPLREPDDVGLPVVPLLGDIVISLETAARQAAEGGLTLDQEVLVLAAHALQHLLGHDHPDAASWRVFTSAQTRVLELAGGAADA